MHSTLLSVAAKNAGWVDIAVAAATIVSAILFGLLSAVALYLALASRLRRDAKEAVTTASATFRRTAEQIEASAEETRVTVLASQADALLAIRGLLPKIEKLVSSEEDSSPMAEASVGLEQQIRKIHVLLQRADEATFWWFAENGDSSALDVLEEYASDPAGQEFHSLAREAIRRIRGRAGRRDPLLKEAAV